MPMKKKFTSDSKIPNRMYPITATCKDCGKEFTISVKEQLFAQEGKGFTLPKRCKDCRANRKAKSKHIVCHECGDVFEFTASEQEFFNKNGFEEPKRCTECRKAKKVNANGQNIAEETK